MIGKLSGIVEYIEDDHFLLCVNNVGYIIFSHTSTISSLKLNQQLTIYTDMHLKDEQMLLYGFVELLEKKWFRLLQTVQGVGGKMALAILGSLSPAQLISAILSDDQHIFKRTPGVGPKIASRLINELKSKFSSSKSSNTMISASLIAEHNKITPLHSDTMDAITALSNLGFNRSAAYKVVADLLAQDDGLSLEQLIKQSLAKLSS